MVRLEGIPHALSKNWLLRWPEQQLALVENTQLFQPLYRQLHQVILRRY